jgi:hypothetical protein
MSTSVRALLGAIVIALVLRGGLPFTGFDMLSTVLCSALLAGAGFYFAGCRDRHLPSPSPQRQSCRRQEPVAHGFGRPRVSTGPAIDNWRTHGTPSAIFSEVARGVTLLKGLIGLSGTACSE